MFNHKFLITKPWNMLHRFAANRPLFPLSFKIFLWFWCTILGWYLVSWMAVTARMSTFSPAPYSGIASFVAHKTIEAYEIGGTQGLTDFMGKTFSDPNKTIYLLNEQNKDVLGRPLIDEGKRLAERVADDQLLIYRNRYFAYRVQSKSGRNYVLLMYVKTVKDTPHLMGLGAGWTSSTLPIIFVVTLLTFFLAHHIASPISGIQSAARRVATGDLKARVPASISARHDELAFLGQDIDFMVDRLEKLLKSHDDLLSSVSHEVRSPLARLNLCLEMLKQGKPEKSEELILRMEHDVAAIDRLISQLLDLSRFESGLSSAARKDVELVPLLEEIAADGNFEASAYRKSVKVLISEPVCIKNADGLALRSAFENIVRNAIHFTKPDSVAEISLALDAQPEGRAVTIAVRDHGPGVPEHLLQEIFKPFFQVKQSGQANTGNGLGLAIAAEAIRMHGGTITAANVQSNGLEVSARIPLLNE